MSKDLLDTPVVSSPVLSSYDKDDLDSSSLRPSYNRNDLDSGSLRHDSVDSQRDDSVDKDDLSTDSISGLGIENNSLGDSRISDLGASTRRYNDDDDEEDRKDPKDRNAGANGRVGFTTPKFSNPKSAHTGSVTGFTPKSMGSTSSSTSSSTIGGGGGGGGGGGVRHMSMGDRKTNMPNPDEMSPLDSTPSASASDSEDMRQEKPTQVR